MTNILLEFLLPGVMQDGLNTNKTTTIGGSANFDMSGSTGTFKFPTGGASGGKAVTVSGSGATVTLTASQSGSTILFDRAAGIIFTLPAPSVGLRFNFIVTTTITSNNAEIDTDAGSTFLLGAPNLVVDNSATSKGFQGNGTSHVKVQMNGTTTGGIKGSYLTFDCVSATVWNVFGNVMASGTLATPFA